MRSNQRPDTLMQDRSSPSRPRLLQRTETGQPVNVGNVCRDITERKRAEAETRENDRRYREMQMDLAHANRVAAMGQLTASIAHEVNQPLAPVIANAEACLRWLDRGTPDLEAVRRSVERTPIARVR
jgi:C4-dicarboxylate-specific signal transduction histidine kinase